MNISISSKFIFSNILSYIRDLPSVQYCIFLIKNYLLFKSRTSTIYNYFNYYFFYWKKINMEKILQYLIDYLKSEIVIIFIIYHYIIPFFYKLYLSSFIKKILNVISSLI